MTSASYHAALIAEASRIEARATISRLPRGYDRDPVGHARKRRILHTVLGLAVPIALLAFWQVAAKNDWINHKFYPAPTDCFRQLKQMFDKRDFAYDLLSWDHYPSWFGNCCGFAD